MSRNSKVTSQALCISHSPLMQKTDASVGAEFRSAVEATRQDIASLDPDLVVIFAPDHRTAFSRVTPSWCLPLSGEGYGDFGTATDQLNIPADLVRILLGELASAKFDVCSAEGLRIDHGCAQSLEDLGLFSATIPVIPVLINCLIPPLAPPSRILAMGQSIGDILRRTGSAEKLLFIGSGGISHEPPNLGPEAAGLTDVEREALIDRLTESAADAIDPQFDRKVLRGFESWGEKSGELISAEWAVGGSGAQELRTWMAAFAASGCDSAVTVAYQPIPEWITGMGIVAGVPVSPP